MNSTAIAFVGGTLCGIVAGIFLFALYLWAVIHLPNDDKNDNNNNF